MTKQEREQWLRYRKEIDGLFKMHPDKNVCDYFCKVTQDELKDRQPFEYLSYEDAEEIASELSIDYLRD